MSSLIEQFKSKLYHQEGALAPTLYVYGNVGMGKSSLAASFPEPFFLMTERAFPNDTRLDGNSIYIKQYKELIDNLRLIYGVLQEGSVNIKTLVLDNVSGIELLIRNDILATTGKTVEGFGFGQGYELLKDYWSREKDGLYNILKVINEQFNVAIVLIDHCTITSTVLPNKDPFNRYAPAALTKVTNYLTKLVDEVMFIDVIYNEVTNETAFGKKNTKVSTSQNGLLIRSGNGQAEYVSKTRYALPLRNVYKPGEGFKILEPYLPAWHKDAVETPPEAQEAPVEAQDNV